MPTCSHLHECGECYRPVPWKPWDACCWPAPEVIAPGSTVLFRRLNALSRRTGAPVYVRRQIVHNLHVVRRLEELGAIFVQENDEVPEGRIVVFSAHGVAPGVHEQAARAAAADHRRHLPAGDQGASGSAPLRRR